MRAHAVEGAQLEGDQLDVVLALAVEPAAHQDDGVLGEQVLVLLADAAEGHHLDAAVDVVQAEDHHGGAAACLTALRGPR